MSVYPEAHTDRRVRHASLQALVTGIFERCGMGSADAELLAGTLVVSDLRGCHSHGVLRVPDYVRKLTVDGVDPGGKPRIAKDAGAALVVDGGNSMGQIGCAFAMKAAIERARQTGLAFAAIRGSNHCGAMAYFAMMAAAEDMIGIAGTNALPTMAPWGGVDKILGINPLGVAIPGGEEAPVVFDAAFSASSHGKIRVYAQKHLPIPEGWAFDKEGRPTTDAVSALDGLLQPIGGYKGTGLALVVGMLSSLLSGAALGAELGDMVNGPKPGRDGHFVMALNIAAFEEVSAFKARVDQAIRQIRSSAKAPGVEKVYPPGHIEAEAEIRYKRDGIPLNQETLDDLAQTAAGLGVDQEIIRQGTAAEVEGTIATSDLP
jgi:LDH2 family malate/lactate/ureidoglycolate dehydrogenase